MKMIRRVGLLAFAGAALASPASAATASKLGVACQTPPPAHCAATGCTPDIFTNLGAATDLKTGRKFFLDYPCDLKPGEKVVFLLSLHGANGTANGHRHYFPAMDYKEKYRLVIATPTAILDKPARMWTGADDAQLQNIADLVFDAFGRRNIKAFWLVGHSQGGMGSNRVICNDYFKSKVDGWLSLSGGRIGAVKIVDGFGPPRPAGSPPASIPGAGTPFEIKFGAADTPSCDLNYIFETGDQEIAGGLPLTSPWADKYGCAPRVRRADIVDTKPGLTSTGAPPPGVPANPAWGRQARPGTAQVFVFPACKGGRLVADVLRLDKGHT
ncbi:MAG: hypothetical protein ABIO37_08785, partial [Caulobacteraceae bacterium]